ncbi:MAG TPA: flagellar FliJ family protein [Candidatus Sulfotelmatobacter sp.]|jgi:flagellar export protein FliJ|nr:flagellar FliJ family protein [Candidatus Sulfotelmatobacter sp.]
MPFQFSLQAILHLRQSIERQQELRLRGANQQVAKVRRLIELADDRIRREQNICADALSAGTTSAELRLSTAAQDLLRAQRQRIETELKRLQTLRDQQQRVFHQARRERETIESLRDRQLMEYKRNTSRREQRRADDLFLLRQSYLRRG